MTSQIEQWRRVSNALGIVVQSPAMIVIEGRALTFTALLPDFGAPKGLIADPEWEAIGPHAAVLIANGFGYSCVAIEETSDFLAMLRDWGWAAKKPKPEWLGSD